MKRGGRGFLRPCNALRQAGLGGAHIAGKAGRGNACARRRAPTGGKWRAAGEACAKSAPRSKTRRRAFFLTLEAASSLLLLAAAALVVPLFWLPESSAGDFFLCSDAALLASKGVYSGADLEGAAQEASRLSGMCISARIGGGVPKPSPGCEPAGREVHAFTFPVWLENRLQNATIACYRA